MMCSGIAKVSETTSLQYVKNGMQNYFDFQSVSTPPLKAQLIFLTQLGVVDARRQFQFTCLQDNEDPNLFNMEQLEECDQNLENEISLFVQDVNTKDSTKLVCIFRLLVQHIC